MTIFSVGVSASTVSINPGANASAGGIAEDENKLDSTSEERKISGDISDHLSVSSKQLLKRLAELQEQLRDLRARMQSAENAAYSNLAAKNSVVASFQSQITAITGAILMMSASLFKELDRSGGMDITV